MKILQYGRNGKTVLIEKLDLRSWEEQLLEQNRHPVLWSDWRWVDGPNKH